jgi:hypothetical protein
MATRTAITPAQALLCPPSFQDPYMGIFIRKNVLL